MPLTVLQGPLSIVASSDLGDLGSHESEPVVVEWHWYEHLPYLFGWLLILALLVIVRENRNGQAWTILIPSLLLYFVLWPWIVRLLGLGSRMEDILGDPIQLLIVGWTAVWLVSPWLARYRPSVIFLLALGLVLLMGAVFYFAVYQSLDMQPILFFYPMAIFTLLLGISLTARSCRGVYRPKAFMAWLVLWLPIGAAISLSGMMVVTMMMNSSVPALSLFLIILTVGSAIIAGMLYLLNLPYMILAFRCPLYRERFQKILRLSEPARYREQFQKFLCLSEPAVAADVPTEPRCEGECP